MEMKRLFGWLVPGRERELVLRELDDLRHRRFGDGLRGRAETWYLTQILAFAIRLRIERARSHLARLPSLAADLRFAVRRLLRRPGYLVSAALVLGIGTGGVGIVFGAAHWVLLRDVPGVGQSDELVRLSLESKDDTWHGQSWGVMQPDVERLRGRMSSLAGLAVATPVQVHLAVPRGGPASRERASMVSPDYFDVLAMRPALGRFFDPGDHDGEAGPREVVVADDLWHQVWNGSTSVLGSEVEVNGH
ncbi:MAG: ABC transporter permease, partial [Gemmatimonadota bacterium]